MYLCYIDESGTPDIPGNTSHFVLAGLSIPIWRWRDCDREVEAIKKKYALSGSEIHVASAIPVLEILEGSHFNFRPKINQQTPLKKII